jgi:hypothetical protein
MPFVDDARDAEPYRPTALLFRCRRCDGLLEEPHPDIDVAVRRAIETGDLLRVHACAPAASGGGALGLLDLIGTSERPPEERHAAP